MATRQHAVNPRSRAGDALSFLVVQIFRLHGLLLAAGDAMARPAGHSSARWQALAAIEDAPASVAEIARALSLTRQSVQRVADVLEHEGFAAYETNPKHRRAKLLCLTQRGHSALQAIQKVQRVWADELGAEIGETDLRRASRVLERLQVALTGR